MRLRKRGGHAVIDGFNGEKQENTRRHKRLSRQPDLESCHMPRRVPLITFIAALRLLRPPSLRASHFRQRDALRVMYEEIIPDSEPEREEQRRHVDQERRVKPTRKRHAPESTRSMSLVLSSSPEPVLSAFFCPLFFHRVAHSTPKGYHLHCQRKLRQSTLTPEV